MADSRNTTPTPAEAWSAALAAYERALAVIDDDPDHVQDAELDVLADAEDALVRTPAPDLAAVLRKMRINLEHKWGRIGTFEEALAELQAADRADFIDATVYRDLARIAAEAQP